MEWFQVWFRSSVGAFTALPAERFVRPGARELKEVRAVNPFVVAAHLQMRRDLSCGGAYVLGFGVRAAALWERK